MNFKKYLMSLNALNSYECGTLKMKNKITTSTTIIFGQKPHMFLALTGCILISESSATL